MPLTESSTNRLNLRSTLKSALVIFLPLLILMGGMAAFIYYLDLKSEIKVAKEKEKQLVEVQKSIITSDFNAIYSHLIILSESGYHPVWAFFPVHLFSWYQGKTGESYPNLECGPGDKPAWIVYAESRGGDITIDINEGHYIFIYLGV